MEDEGVGLIDPCQIGVSADDAGGADEAYGGVDIERGGHRSRVVKGLLSQAGP